MQRDYSEIVQIMARLPEKELTLERLKELKRDFARKENLPALPSNISLIRNYQQLVKAKKIKQSDHIETVLRKRGIRSQSGIVSVQVLTKPFRCPGECIFCPNDPSMPKSYIKSEPGAMRAFLNQFDPYKQAYNRLLSLTLTGHKTDKIEMIVLGGTRDVYPDDYKKEFVKSLYDVCNSFPEFYSKVKLPEDLSDKEFDKLSDEKKKYGFRVDKEEDIKYPETLEESIEINQTAENRIIGLTIETRPEYVTDENCQLRRELGVTRIEMGVQSLFDDVLIANKRGHGVKEIREAMHKLRQYAFKVSIHIMPGLYKSTFEKDIQTFEKTFSDPFLKPDEIKFYPTSVIPNTELENLYKSKQYIPLTTEQIKITIHKVLKDIIPPYIRIKRLIRDIPTQEIVAGSTVTNLSQLTRLEMEKELKKGDIDILTNFYKRLYGEYKLVKTFNEVLENIVDTIENDEIRTFILGENPNFQTWRNFVSLDTRSREIRNKRNKENKIPQRSKESPANFVVREFKSSVGREFFLSFEDKYGYLYGFTRLLLPNEGETIDCAGLGGQTALIRELHVYGNVETIKSEDKSKSVQHKGFGKQLMEYAEQIVKSQNYTHLSVISGIGVRQYYQKLGYNLKGTYMVKKF